MSTAKILLLDNPERINTCGNSVHFTGLTLCRGLGRPKNTLNKLEEVDAVSGAAFAIRRDLFDELGGFDEDTFLYMEDTDLSWRARLAGWRALYAPTSVVLHQYTLRLTSQKVFYQERNRYLMLLKNLKWPTLLLLMPSLALAEVLTWGFVLLRDRENLRNKLLAYRWVMSNWNLIMEKRRATQALRKLPDRELLSHTSHRLEYGQAGGSAAVAADMLFEPMFLVLRAVTMALMRW